MAVFKDFSASAGGWFISLGVDTKLSHRLSGGFGFLLVMMVLTIGLALLQMGQMQQQMRHIVESNVASIAATQAMMDAVNGVSISTLGFAFAHDEEDAKYQLQEVEKRLALYEQAQSRFDSLSRVNGESAIASDLRERLENSARTTRELVTAVARTASTGGNPAHALASLYPQKVQAAWTQDIKILVQAEQAQCLSTYEGAREAYLKIRMLLMGVTAAALLIGVFAAWAILRSVTRPINLAIEHAERISQGDLRGDIEVRGGDEVAGLLRTLATMQDQLRRMIGQVRDASDEIRSATEDVSSGGRDLSNRTEATAASLQQTAAFMERLVALVNQGAQAGQNAKQWAGDAAVVAGKGGEVMGQVVSTMEEIDQSSRRIGQIVAVIDSIAFQTNILALNAAVEAAGAGEHGRGFAVVASEVRSLASRSTEAAREIRALIASSVERIDSGAQLVRSAGSTMSEIVTAVQRVHGTIEEISGTLAQQHQSMREVGAAVQHVDQLTQQNAALAEESAASTLVLEGQSSRLYEAVKAFKG